MKITHLIGNGFDINIGLKTRYTQFLDYYLSTEYRSIPIELFKKRIKRDFDTWSDFELKFGAYTAELNSVDDFIELFEDVRNHLKIYLQSELNKFDLNIDESLKTTLLTGLIEPQKYLTLREQLIFENLQRKYMNTTPWTTNVVTFNYTEVLDQIIGLDNTYIFNILSKDLRFQIPSVIHLHGNLSERLTFGVNDIAQIGNTNFHGDEDITNTFIKPNFNIALGHLLDEQVKTEIETSHIICLFGVSLGRTDYIWWEIIGNKLRTSIDTYLIVFIKSDVNFPKSSPKEVREKNRIRKEILKAIGVNSNNDTGKISDKIFVAPNTDMLKFNLARKI